MNFERAREELGMNRSQYVRYLIGGQKEIRPVSIKHQEMISKLASIDRNIKENGVSHEYKEYQSRKN